MKRSLVWTAVGAAVIGIGVPAYASSQSNNSAPTINTVMTTVEDVRGNCDEAEHANDPACTSSTTATTAAATTKTAVVGSSTTLEDSTTSSIDDSTSNSVDDDATENSTENSVDDDATDNSVDDDDATENSVEDVSGNCDEAEHANDAACTGAAAPVSSVDDNSGSGSDHSGGDGGGHGGGSDD